MRLNANQQLSPELDLFMKQRLQNYELKQKKLGTRIGQTKFPFCNTPKLGHLLLALKLFDELPHSPSTTLVPLLNLITFLFIPTTNSNLASDSSTSRNDSYERVYGDVPSHDVVWRVIAFDADSDKEFTDIIYEKAVEEGIAKISINRPERRNTFRPNTVKELICAFNDARHDSSIGVFILTGKGTKAFCSGGDQALRIADGYFDNEDIGSLNVLDLQNHPAVVVPRLPAGLNLPSPDNGILANDVEK
ncbi:hypothetical protein Ahy_B06g081727 [Arachis hypogaea]|uniref:1,4-dihydroxy-2-naphthoyl-CoA synthase n=1 Tax=Arachis hypogaea TaxID=3818 RepID=A0A444YLQ6_ARAHY|nr:hypothetical protein Ahy_B06g081727 [Arachis hypogaea]